MVSGLNQCGTVASINACRKTKSQYVSKVYDLTMPLKLIFWEEGCHTPVPGLRHRVNRIVVEPV